MAFRNVGWWILMAGTCCAGWCAAWSVGASMVEGAEAPLAQRLSDLAVRESALELRVRGDVVQEIVLRARELGVEADAEELADVLFQRAKLQFEAERCGLLEEACPATGSRLAAVERRFQRLAGLSAVEFQRGYRSADLDSLPAQGLIFPSGSTRTDPQHCACSASVANLDRWVGQYWGLECACHSGDGLCSSNLDVCGIHSSGSGAMTGDVMLAYGGDWRSRSCPDDHRTCFKGPHPTKPGGGDWTNVCNCDTQHSQYTSPLSSFFGGTLQSPEVVWQTSFSNLVSDGPCGLNASFAIYEYIKENDPWCCDDPMGTLSASFPVLEGTTSQDRVVSVVNCNGGSQSGQPPNCGSFGATLRLASTCETRPDDSFGSCYGRCGELLPEATCNCEFDCEYFGDCCWDYCDACANGGLGGPSQVCGVGGF